LTTHQIHAIQNIAEESDLTTGETKELITIAG
jgi:hypothetical protein